MSISNKEFESVIRPLVIKIGELCKQRGLPFSFVCDLGENYAVINSRYPTAAGMDEKNIISQINHLLNDNFMAVPHEAAKEILLLSFEHMSPQELVKAKSEHDPPEEFDMFLSQLKEEVATKRQKRKLKRKNAF